MSRQNKEADSQEVIASLTAIMRCKAKEEVVVIESYVNEEGKTEHHARTVEKTPSVHDRISAAKLIGKHLGMFDTKRMQGKEKEAAPIVYGEEELK